MHSVGFLEMVISDVKSHGVIVHAVNSAENYGSTLKYCVFMSRDNMGLVVQMIHAYGYRTRFYDTDTALYCATVKGSVNGDAAVARMSTFSGNTDPSCTTALSIVGTNPMRFEGVFDVTFVVTIAYDGDGTCGGAAVSAVATGITLRAEHELCIESSRLTDWEKSTVSQN